MDMSAALCPLPICLRGAVLSVAFLTRQPGKTMHTMAWVTAATYGTVPWDPPQAAGQRDPGVWVFAVSRRDSCPLVSDCHRFRARGLFLSGLSTWATVAMCCAGLICGRRMFAVGLLRGGLVCD